MPTSIVTIYLLNVLFFCGETSYRTPLEEGNRIGKKKNIFFKNIPEKSLYLASTAYSSNSSRILLIFSAKIGTLASHQKFHC